MTLRNRIGLVIVWAASIVAAGGWARAQAPVTPPPSAQPLIVLSGSDLGFRVDRQKGNAPVGALVARVNGQWVEVEFAVGMKRLTMK